MRDVSKEALAESNRAIRSLVRKIIALRAKNGVLDDLGRPIKYSRNELMVMGDGLKSLAVTRRNEGTVADAGVFLKSTLESDMRQAVKDKYKLLGVDVRPSYRYPGKVESVQLGLTDAQWGDVLNKEGKSLPSCCGDISRVRDILFDARREGGMIGASDLAEAATLLRRHGFKEDQDCPLELLVILRLAAMVKKDSGGYSPVLTSDINSPQDVIHMMEYTCRSMSYNDLFDRGPEPKEEEFRDRKAYLSALASHRTRKVQHAAFRLQFLAKLIPLVSTLHGKISELNPGPIEAYAIVGEDGNVLETRSGYAIFHDRKYAAEAIRAWRGTVKEEGKLGLKVPVLKVREVTISLDKGMQFSIEMGHKKAPEGQASPASPQYLVFVDNCDGDPWHNADITGEAVVHALKCGAKKVVIKKW